MLKRLKNIHTRQKLQDSLCIVSQASMSEFLLRKKILFERNPFKKKMVWTGGFEPVCFCASVPNYIKTMFSVRLWCHAKIRRIKHL